MKQEDWQKLAKEKRAVESEIKQRFGEMVSDIALNTYLLAKNMTQDEWMQEVGECLRRVNFGAVEFMVGFPPEKQKVVISFLMYDQLLADVEKDWREIENLYLRR